MFTVGRNVPFPTWETPVCFFFFFLVIPFIPYIFTHTRQWGGGQTGKDVSWFQGWESKDVNHRDPAAQTINQVNLPFRLSASISKSFSFFFYSKAHESELPGVSWESQWRMCVAPEDVFPTLGRTAWEISEAQWGLRARVAELGQEPGRCRAAAMWRRLLPFGQRSITQESKVHTLNSVKPQNSFAPFSFLLLS